MTVLDEILWKLNPLDVLLQLLFGRVLFAALALCALTAVIAHARGGLSPVARSWLWAGCIPALFLPFEHSAVFIAKKLGVFSAINSFTTGRVPWLLLLVLAFIWLLGVLISAVRTGAGQFAALRHIKNGRLDSCAAYFAGFRSHVYLPPDFERDYSPEERQMLLAHERQHVRQHDPLLYAAMQWLLCVFWFCPQILAAVRLIRQDRELLCDERASRHFSKREYGMLLLREAAKATPQGLIAGIAADSGGMYERISACAGPFTGRKKAAAPVAGFAVCVLAFGVLGVINPVVYSPDHARVYHGPGPGSIHVTGAERFVTVTEEGAVVDKQGLREFADAKGFTGELRVAVSYGRNALLTSFATVFNDCMVELDGADAFNHIEDTKVGVLYAMLGSL